MERNITRKLSTKRDIIIIKVDMIIVGVQEAMIGIVMKRKIDMRSHVAEEIILHLHHL